jgi:hypothetical protein
MATTSLPGLAEEPTHHPARGQITRLSWRGWHVHLDGESVRVPVQDGDGKSIDDLDDLLTAAYRMLNIPIARRPSTLAALRAGLPAPLTGRVVQILRAAQRLADNRWGSRSSGVYDCTHQAWQDAGMGVPYTLLVTALRAALPQPGASLADYHHTATAAALHTLYDHAVGLCCTGRPVADTSRSA